MSADGLSHDNAFYLGTANTFIFVPYTKQGLPVMVNAGVVAHEHFHSLFQGLVLDKVHTPQRLTGLFNPHEWAGRLGQINAKGEIEVTARDQYQAVMIRGLNEGLADVWAWIYTNDSVFVGRSLPEFKKMRDLDIKDGKLFSESSLKEFNALNGFASGATLTRSYELGMQYARLIKSFVLDYAAARGFSSVEIRIQLSRWIILSLKDFQGALAELKPEDSMPPTRYIEVLFRQIPDLNKAECDKVINHLDAEDRTKAKLKCGN